jgi:hypothetical protein
MRHGIQMGADHQDGRRPVAAGQRHIQIGRIVMTDFQTECLGRLGDCGVRPLLARTVGVAGDTWFVQSVLPQLVEQRFH